MHYDITICSVSYYSSYFLRSNLQILKEQDSNVKIHYLVCENSNNQEEIDALKDFHIINGYNEPNINRWSASKNHGRGLNTLLPFIDTRFVLFLDPDFFMFAPISLSLAHMEQEELAFWGAPYYKGRRLELFPAAFCQFVDLDKVDKNSLDFMPDDINVMDFLLDVGHKNWLTHKDKKYGSVIRDYEFKAEYSIYKMDGYYWRNKMFGLHLHQKIQKGEKYIKEGRHRFKELNKRFLKEKKKWHSDTII